MDSFETLRPVGRLERYSTARHHLRFYLGVAVTATYTLPAESCSVPLKNFIYAACGTLIGQHPSLSAIALHEDTNNPQFVRLPQIPLDECVLFQKRRHDIDIPTSSSSSSNTHHDGRDVELEQLLSAQLSTPFTAPSPFWRLCILTGPGNKNEKPYQFTAAFIYHHAIGDGMSGAAFHRTFYNALSQALLQPPPKDLPAEMVTVPSPQTPLLPNLELIHPLPVTWTYLLTAFFREKLWKPARDPGLWTAKKITTPLEETQVRILRISGSTTRAFAGACRENGTTVSAALQTLVAGALFIHLPENFTKLHCPVPLSMRRWLSESILAHNKQDATAAVEDIDDCMGVWVQDFEDQYCRDKFPSRTALPWDEARRSRRNIEDVLSLRGQNTGPGLLRYVRNFHEELFLSKVGQEREASYEISNLGICRTRKKQASAEEESGPGHHLEIGQLVFSQAGGVTGAAFGVGVITGEDGCLTLSFSRKKGIMEDDLLESVIETVRKALVQFENDSSGG